MDYFFSGGFKMFQDFYVDTFLYLSNYAISEIA